MADEDFDLKEALVRSLRENGFLPNLQAQLKAAVYLALEKHNYDDGLPPTNPRIRSMLSSEDGLIIASLLADFLTQMDLNNTINVLKHELQMDQLSLLDRESLSSMLKLHTPTDDVPIITILLKAYKSLRTSDMQTHSSGSPDNHDNVHAMRCSKIPLLQNRRTKAPMSHSPNESSRVPNGVTNPPSGESNCVIKTAEPFQNDENSSNTNASCTYHKSGDAEVGNDGKISSQAPDHTITGFTNVSKANQEVRVDPNGVLSPLRPESKTSHDQDYGDDFESPRSQESHGSLSVASRSGDGDHHEKHVNSRNNASPKSVPSFLVDMRTNHVVRMDGTSSPLSAPLSESSLNYNEKLLISRSGTNSPSVIRVYAPAKRRTPSNEASSDVDDEDEDIPEILGREDSESDTVDQTVDSEQSLKLDYVEDVQSPRRSATPTPAV